MEVVTYFSKDRTGKGWRYGNWDTNVVGRGLQLVTSQNHVDFLRVRHLTFSC
jgi:hypothetical protein